SCANSPSYSKNKKPPIQVALDHSEFIILNSSLDLEHFPSGEMECTFNSSILIAVTSVNRILPYGSSIFFSDGALSSICRIGSSYKRSEILNCVFLLKNGSYNWTSGHELNKFTEEWTLVVNSIKSLGICFGHLGLLQRHDPES